MPRKKVHYNYWELPQWVNATVEVEDEFELNGRKRMLLVDGSDRYTVKRPKRDEWKDVKKNDIIFITKHLNTPTSARIELVAIVKSKI